MKLLSKKFKVSVVFDYYCNGKSYYKIKYTQYRLFPNWKKICKIGVFPEINPFMKMSFTNYDKAIEFAKAIKSINDVNKIHEAEYEKYQSWKKEQNDLWQKNKPPRKTTIIL